MDPNPSTSDDLAGGLREAFRETAPQRASILRRLQEKTSARLDLCLHDATEDPGAPVTIDEAAKALRDPTGRYQVLGEIGRGGVGIVYKGRDQDLGRDVAMKVLRPEYAARPEILERFVEEAQIGGQLQHPGIVPVYELGLQHGERPYFAMRLVKGETLASLLARRADASEDRRKLLGIFEQVCQTIAYAHARAVVHRDLKPSNVMLGSFGEVQVVDWGFAKVLQRRSHEDAARPRSSSLASVISTVRSHPVRGSHSVVGSMFGTPAYMPPEQALGDVEHMDQRSDVFGLGAILCEILTGAPPYREQDGDLVQQAARAELGATYERIERSGADAALTALCRQCLSPARAARPESAQQVASAVCAYLSSVEERARRAEIHAAEAKVRARSTLLLSAAAVLLLAFGSAGYLYVQREAQVRKERAAQRVAAALDEANLRLGEARVAAATDLGPWTRAHDAAEVALELAEDPAVQAEQRARVHAILAIVEQEQARASVRTARDAKDTVMRRRLLEARIPSDTDHDPIGQELRASARRTEAYAAAFAEYLDGRVLTDMTAEQGAAALGDTMATELATALDDWVFGCLRLARASASTSTSTSEQRSMETTERLQQISRALDPDPWRNHLREASGRIDPDRAALERLQAEADLPALPAMSSSLLASALADAGALDAARAIYRTACEHHPADFDCVFSLGLLCEKSDALAEAVRCFRIARALRPKLLEVRHKLGMALGQSGDHSGDLRIFRELAQEEPENAHWQFHLGVLHSSARKHAESAAYYQRSIELDPTYAVAHSNLGLELLKLERADEAVAVFRRAIELHENGQTTYGLGSALLERGDLDEAITSLRRAIELDAGHVAAHANLGNALLKQGLLEEGIASLRRAIELDPKESLPHYNLGLALERQGSEMEALACLRRSIELDPGSARAHGALGRLLLGQGQLDEAIACLRRATACDDGLLTAHYNLARALRRQGLFEEATERFRRVVELDPLRADVHFELGEVLRSQGQLGPAIASLRRAIELDPEHNAAHVNLGIALGLQGKYDEEITCYRRAIEIDPEVARTHLNLGLVLARRQGLDDAVACFSRAIELDPQMVEAHQALGSALHLEGRHDEGASACRRALAIDPGHALSHYILALALVERNAIEEALEHLRQAASIWSRATDAPGIEFQRIAAESIERFERDLEKMPERLALARGEISEASADEFVAAAALAYRRGEHLAAVRTFARAFAKFPDLPAARHYRQAAACAAALVGMGKGEGAAALGEEERARWREQALQWLAEEIELRRLDLAAEDGEPRRFARQWLARLRHDRAFEDLRGEPALRALPALEADRWRALWRQVAELAENEARK